MHDAILFDRLADRQVRCRACLWRCVIPEGAMGVCRTRLNHEGALKTLIYGRAASVAVDPIEKKPLFHFHPGTRVYSMGTLGCNFSCHGCQNASLSHTAPQGEFGDFITPEQAVDAAIRLGASGICWTYNEPAIWLEYILETAAIAKARGLYTAYVTNGAATREHLDKIGPHLDAYRVDIKAYTPEAYKRVAGFADAEGIRDSTAYARKRWKLHVECVTNIIPTINDQDDELRGIARWIARALGQDTPWHITRFFPCEEFAHLPQTPTQRLDRAYAFGRKEGLAYIYTGNIAGDARQDTFCPKCRRLLIRRHDISMAQSEITAGGCPRCKTSVAGVW
jgi:pyruvate formate lyase activating enzyme